MPATYPRMPADALSGRMAVYVTPIGLFSMTAAGPNAPVVPGTGRAAWASAIPPRAVTRRVECIMLVDRSCLLTDYRVCCAMFVFYGHRGG